MRVASAIWLFVLCSAAQAAPNAQDIAAYRALVAQDLRLATVSYRLASANALFCKNKERNPGWVLHSYREYPDREVAQAAFAFPTPVAIAAVVDDGPAAKAGLREGYGLEDVSGGIWWGGELQRHVASVELIETVTARMRELFAGPMPVSLKFSPPSQDGVKTFELVPPAICASTFWVDAKSKIDAGADGKGVRVTSGLIEFVPNDAELAAAIAHEFAHNMLGHRERLKAKGGTKAVLATEIEADRLSVWLMANAGYDPNAALRFAERYGRKTGLGIFSDGTHLRWKNRVKVMQAEINLMAATPKQNGLLPPPLLMGGG